MSLTDEDIDRLADKIELRLMSAMEKHKKEEHGPLEKQIEVIKRWQWGERGALALLAAWLGLK